MHREDVREAPVIPLAPDVAVVAHVDKLGADRQIVAMLNHASGEHALNLEISPCCLRIGLLPFVAKHGVARHNREVGHLREVVDETLGDAVREVFGVRITADVGEGQNGERLNRLAAPGHQIDSDT